MSILHSPKVTVRPKLKELTGRRKPFQVIWRVDGSEKTRAFESEPEARKFQATLEGYKAAGEPFDSVTGMPARLSETSSSNVTCFEWAKEVVAAEWDTLAPTSNRGIVEGLATMLPGLVAPSVFRVMSGLEASERARQRTSLERALKKTLPPEPQSLSADEAVALEKFKGRVVPLAHVGYVEISQARQLASTNLDGVTKAAHSTFARKNQALSKLFTRAIGRKMLAEHPFKELSPTETRASRTNVRKSNAQVVTLAEAAQLVSRISHAPTRRACELMLFAGLRPAEVNALRAGDVETDGSGRVYLNLQRSAPEVPKAFSRSGTDLEVRPLKWRAEGQNRRVMLSAAFGERVLTWADGLKASDGLCMTSSGKVVSARNRSRAFHAARAAWVADMPAPQRPGPDVLSRPYMLRHVCATTLANEWTPAEAAAHLGHSVSTLLTTYVRPVDGRQRDHGAVLDALFDVE